MMNKYHFQEVEFYAVENVSDHGLLVPPLYCSLYAALTESVCYQVPHRETRSLYSALRLLLHCLDTELLFLQQLHQESDQEDDGVCHSLTCSV